MLQKKNPKFFKWAYVAGGFTQFSSALAVSVNTLLVALGATPLQISLANSAKLIGQVFSQLFGLEFINRFSSHRNAMQSALSLELIVKLALAVIAFTVPVHWFALIMIIMFLLGVLAYTSFLTYYSWMGEIVPSEFKNMFFANRSMWGQILMLAGLGISSWVLKIHKPILYLLGILYVAYYLARNIEVLSYFFHPDAAHQRLIKNHIRKRMELPLQEKRFVWFMVWYNMTNTASVLNLLFLEFFIIHILKFSFFWIPVSFVVVALGTMINLYLIKKFFSAASAMLKMTSVSALLVCSSVAWLFSTSPIFLVMALILAGASDSAVTMVQRVEVINYAKGKDKDAYYASFNTVEYVISSLAVLTLGLLQKSAFSFRLIFFITIPMSLLSLIFIQRSDLPLQGRSVQIYKQ